MIFGIGCDIVNIERLKKDQRFLDHFIKRSFSAREREFYETKNFADNRQRALYIAKRFAAKEAVAKALGTGFREGLYLSNIEIFTNDLGKPFVSLSDDAVHLFKQYIGKSDYEIFISLSDDAPFAQAMAIIELS